MQATLLILAPGDRGCAKIRPEDQLGSSPLCNPGQRIPETHRKTARARVELTGRDLLYHTPADMTRSGVR